MKLIKVKLKFLGRYTRYFYVIKSEKGDPPVFPQRHLPGGSVDLMLNLGNAIYHANADKKIICLPEANLSGPFDKHFFSEYTGEVHMIGILFKSEASSLILKDRTDSIRGMFVSADLIFHSEISLIVERLRCVSDPLEIALILEEFLIPKFLSRKEPYHFLNVQKAVELIQAKKGNITQQELLDVICLSERQFRRIFTEYTGCSPKEYARVVRVKNILRLLNKGKSIYDIAFELGYYDPSHLVNDFKDIAGISPLEFLRQINEIDRNYLKFHK